MPLDVIDVSSNNSHPIDWAAVKASGIAAVIVKLTEGDDYVNPFAAADCADARKAGLLVAGYHFVHPEQSVGAQLAWLKAHLFGCRLVVIDSELNNAGKPDWTMTTAHWSQVAVATRSMLLGAHVFAADAMLYSSPGFIANLTGAPWGHPLWLADYSPTRPAGAQLWQYTDSATVPGITGGVDRSHFYGTHEQLAVLFGYPSPAPKPSPKPAPKGPDVKLLDTVQIKTSILGNGMADTSLAWASRGPLTLQANEGMKSSGTAYATPVNGKVRVVVTGCPRLKTVAVDVYEVE